MRIDISRQPLFFIFIQSFLLLGLFWIRYSFYPDNFETLNTQLTHLKDFSENHVVGYLSPGNYINSFAEKMSIAAELLAVILIFVNGFLITKTMSKNLVFPTRTYIPCIFYILVSCGIYFCCHDLASVIASFLLVRATTSFMSSFVRSDSTERSFQGAFMLGITPLLSPFASIYIFIIPVAMILFKRSGRQSFTTMLGAFIPLLAWSYIEWGKGGDFLEPVISIKNNLLSFSTIEYTNSALDIARLTVAGILFVILLFSLATFLSNRREMRVRANKILTLMLFFMVITTAAIFLAPSKSISMLPFAAIPIAYIAPVYFIRYKNNISGTLYLIFLIGVVTLNIMPFLL